MPSYHHLLASLSTAHCVPHTLHCTLCSSRVAHLLEACAFKVTLCLLTLSFANTLFAAPRVCCTALLRIRFRRLTSLTSLTSLTCFTCATVQLSHLVRYLHLLWAGLYCVARYTRWLVNGGAVQRSPVLYKVFQCLTWHTWLSAGTSKNVNQIFPTFSLCPLQLSTPQPYVCCCDAAT